MLSNYNRIFKRSRHLSPTQMTKFLTLPVRLDPATPWRKLNQNLCYLLALTFLYLDRPKKHGHNYTQDPNLSVHLQPHPPIIHEHQHTWTPVLQAITDPQPWGSMSNCNCKFPSKPPRICVGIWKLSEKSLITHTGWRNSKGSQLQRLRLILCWP